VGLGSCLLLFGLVGWFRGSGGGYLGISVNQLVPVTNSILERTRGTRWVSSRSREILEIISRAAVPVLSSAPILFICLVLPRDSEGFV
jgi:hypothetical protein